MLDLTFNTKIRESLSLIREGGMTSFVDHEDIRYLIDVSLAHLGHVQFIPYRRDTQEPLGWLEQYRFGMQSTWGEAILGPGPRTRKTPQNFPDYPEAPRSSPEQGQVIPDYL